MHTKIACQFKMHRYCNEHVFEASAPATFVSCAPFCTCPSIRVALFRVGVLCPRLPSLVSSPGTSASSNVGTTAAASAWRCSDLIADTADAMFRTVAKDTQRVRAVRMVRISMMRMPMVWVPGVGNETHGWKRSPRRREPLEPGRELPHHGSFLRPTGTPALQLGLSSSQPLSRACRSELSYVSPAAATQLSPPQHQ